MESQSVGGLVVWLDWTELNDQINNRDTCAWPVTGMKKTKKDAVETCECLKDQFLVAL